MLAEQLDLELVSPPDHLLQHVPGDLLGRRIEVTTLGSLSRSDFPAFAKSVVPKQFTAGVYHSFESVRKSCQGLPDDTEVFLSEIVELVAAATRPAT